MTDKFILRSIAVVSVVVFGVVALLSLMPKAADAPSFVQFLPKLNAVLNGTCFLLLVYSYTQIRQKNIKAHKAANLTAFGLSSIFLVSYIIFHAFGVETRFPADNPLRGLYLGILISHIILAAVVLPLVLMSFYYGLTGKIVAHKRLTKFSMPIWLYVTSTGVVVYLMISPYYKF